MLFMRKLKSLKSILCLGLALGGVPGYVVAQSGPEVVATESKESVSNSGEVSDTMGRYYDLLSKNEELLKDKFLLEGEVAKLKQEKIQLQVNSEKYKRRMNRYKKKYEQKKNNVSPEEVQNEIEKVKAQMLLEFTGYLGEYIKSNPKKKVKNIDLRGLLNRLITFNISYTNNGDTMVAPLAAKGTAKATVAGAAITS